MIKNSYRKISIIFSIIVLLFSSTLLLNLSENTVNAANIVDSTEEMISKAMQKIEVKVNSTGLKINETAEGFNKNENALTKMSDMLLHGMQLYTTDSVITNDLNGAEAGSTIVGDMGFIPVDSNGEKIDSIEITLQAFTNVTTSEAAAKIYDNSSWLSDMWTRQDFINFYANNYENVISSNYGEYTTLYNTKITFTDDGKFILHIPEEAADDYFLAIKAMENPETGEMVEIGKYFRLFIALNNGKPNEDEKKTDDGHRYYFKDSTTTNYADLEPYTSAAITSNKYDVENGIPTSENLTYQLTADNALYDITTRTTTVKAGVRDITIKLTASYTQKHSKTEVNDSGDKVTKTWTTTEWVTKTVTKDYSYELPEMVLYDVPSSNIYPVQGGTVLATKDGNILSGGNIGLTGSNLSWPQILNVTANLPNVKDEESQYIGHYSSKTAAKNALDKNDGTAVKERINAAVHAAVSYTGNVNYSYYGLNVTTTTNNGVTPTVERTGNSTTKMIPSTYPNGLYFGGGNVMYAGGFVFPATPNNVKVHTPVIDNSYISSTSEFINQKINIDPNRKYLMLDEQFTIYIPTNGTHIDIKGYGTRNYNSNQGVTGLKTTWGKIKDVKLPFDAYLHYTKNATSYKYFVKANTWLSESGASSVISLTNNSYTFTIPVWVTETTYDIQTRVIAENAVDSSMYALTEAKKNSSDANYVATNTIPVEVIGKIYDLRVSASNDPGWSSIYSWANKTTYIDATEFPFGAAGQNRNTAYKYAPKLGYTFVFDFKTKGTKSNNIDISVQPEGFYFISRDGKTTQEVDLYYNTTSKNYIKITPSDNNVNLSVRLRDSFLKVAAQEFVDSTRIYNPKYNYSLAVKIGTLAKLNLPQDLRLCYNNFDEYVNALYGRGSTVSTISSNAGSTDTVIGSVGHWYAGYRLPASTKAVPVGTNINTAIKDNSFLTDGYILVKFDIKTKHQNSVGNYEYLQYMGPEGLNEAGDNTGILNPDWTKDTMQTITLPNGNPAQVPVGSVAIYDASLRSSNDSESGGTH